MITVGRLHVITDTSVQSRHGHVDLARLVLGAGATTVQYRRKDASTRVMLGEAAAIRELCLRHRASLIVNDRADVALACDAHGVHLGADDLPLSLARTLLGPARAIGGSADSGDEAAALAAAGADYAGIGPVFGTRSKGDTGPVLGLDGLRAAVTRAAEAPAPIPLIAIGGITLDNVAAVLETGVHGVAVLSAICADPDPAAATARFLALVQGA